MVLREGLVQGPRNRSRRTRGAAPGRGRARARLRRVYAVSAMAGIEQLVDDLERSYREAIHDALREELARDARVILFGEDIGRAGGAFKVTEGLQAEFGAERIRDTPIAEEAIAKGKALREKTEHLISWNGKIEDRAWRPVVVAAIQGVLRAVGVDRPQAEPRAVHRVHVFPAIVQYPAVGQQRRTRIEQVVAADLPHVAAVAALMMSAIGNASRPDRTSVLLLLRRKPPSES